MTGFAAAVAATLCTPVETTAADIDLTGLREKKTLPSVKADSAHIHELMQQRVIVGHDTVSIILPQRNYGRYDRGLYNFLFIPKGEWAVGLTASYGSIDSKDMQLFNTISDLNFEGKQYAIRPTVSYFFTHNSSLGVKLAYTRGEANLNSLSVDIDDDLNFSLKDVGYFSRMLDFGIFYRNYVGLSTAKRFGVFNEVDLSVGLGRRNFRRYYDSQLRDTRTDVTRVSLNFSPGLCVFLLDNLSFNVSFGVFGLHFTNEKQHTTYGDNGVTEDGSRFSSGANFKFNIFNINFGIGVLL